MHFFRRQKRILPAVPRPARRAAHAEHFWIHLGDKYVYISYYAVRSEKGEYLGTVEVTQDIAPLQHISGEKRLLSEQRE